MQYLHYIHINKNWFYYFSESDYNKSFRPYEGSGRISDKLIWFEGEDTTKSNAKKILQEKFPNYEPILNYSYHKSMRLSGCGNGSRPYKQTYGRKR